MNLLATMELYGGGEGSGCNPAVAVPGCGPHPGEHTEQPPKKQWKAREWGAPRPHLVAGYFRNGTVLAHVYSKLAAAQGQWHKVEDIEKELSEKMGRKVYNISQNTLKAGGKKTGRWSLEISGGQVRLFVMQPGEKKEPATTDKQTLTAQTLAAKVMELQTKYHGPNNIPRDESVKLFNQYYQDMGVSQQSRQAFEDAVRSWSGSAHSTNAQTMRMVAMEFYGRSPKDEYTDGAPNGIKLAVEQGVGGMKTAANNMKDAVMAAKAYASAYAQANNVSVVYRGVQGESAQEIRNALKNAEAVDIPINSLSSWSSSHDKASHFAGSSGIVLKMKIDPDNVWAVHKATPWLFSAHAHENEYIVGAWKGKERFTKDDIEVKQSPWMK